MTSRNRGFGLVEIMVGLVVGLISMLVIMQVYSAFEGQKRATTSGSDAQTNGALALYLMEREIRAAGYGLTESEPKYPPLAGCLMRVNSPTKYLVPNHVFPFDSTAKLANTKSDIRFAPIVVSEGGSGGKNSDGLTLIYGTASVTTPYTLTPDAANYSAPGGSIKLTNTSGIGENGRKDMVALIEEDSSAGANYIKPKPCSLLQVTGVPVGGVVPVSENIGLWFSSSALIPARLYNLGQVNMVTYRIGTTDTNGGKYNLVADITRFGVTPNGAAGVPVDNRTDPMPVASNIVNMQVQYGVDTGNVGAGPCKSGRSERLAGDPGDSDAIVDTWVDATGVWANNGATTPSMSGEFNLRRIRAVRIGLVARSATMAEKPPGNDPNLCTTTVASPIFGWNGVAAMTPDLSDDPAWKCYRYEVFQTTIPLRNTLWSRSMNPASSASCNN